MMFTVRYDLYLEICSLCATYIHTEMLLFLMLLFLVNTTRFVMLLCTIIIDCVGTVKQLFFNYEGILISTSMFFPS